MRAMILAAGYGTRLWPLSIDRAKPAIPFMGRPLVGYVAEYLARYGCRDVIVNLHHQAASVRTALGDGNLFGVRLHYVEEPVIMGTSGALDNARALFEDDPFIVINGKLATDIDLKLALQTHHRTSALATLVLRPNPLCERYSTVLVEDGMVQGFGSAPTACLLASDNEEGSVYATKECEKASLLEKENVARTDKGGPIDKGDFEKNPESIEGEVPLMFTGIQILDPRIFSYIPRGVFSHSTTDVYPQAIARGERVAAHIAHDGMWHELSTIQRYLDTSLMLLEREGQDVVVGENTIIEEGADVRGAVLWENVTVEAGGRVRRAVLGAGVRIRGGETIEDCAVVRADLIRGGARPPKALDGEVRSSNFVVPVPR